MYDVHYLCRARYDSGYSCLHQVSSLLSDCVKLSDVLTMPLSFRSNVNYIPPPQEVSCFFVFGPVSPYHVEHIVVDTSSSHLPNEMWLYLTEITRPSPQGNAQAIILKQTKEQVSIQSLIVLFLSLSPRISNTPSHSCSEKLAFL